MTPQRAAAYRELLKGAARLQQPARFIVSADGSVEDTRPPATPPIAPPKYAARLVREKRVRNRIAGGETIYASDGAGYVASNVTWNALTLRLAIPKVRGKAVRKAAKRERQRQMNGALRRQAAVEARAEF